MKFTKVVASVSGLSHIARTARSLVIVYDIDDDVGSRCWPEDPGIQRWLVVYIHIRKRRAIWISASVAAHHSEITPLYLVDNGNRLRGRKWLRLPREDSPTAPVFALWLFNLPPRSISPSLCLPCASYIPRVPLLHTSTYPIFLRPVIYCLKIYFAHDPRYLYILFDSFFSLAI